jgi:hypothetical protein
MCHPFAAWTSTYGDAFDVPKSIETTSTNDAHSYAVDWGKSRHGFSDSLERVAEITPSPASGIFLAGV